jgi:hypothetical protein
VPAVPTRLVAGAALVAGLVVAGIALAPWLRATGPTGDPAPETLPPPSTALDEAADRPVAELDGRRFAVGEPGDVVAVGDWACTGRPVAAVLRPRTGDVFVFTTWAAPGGTLEAEAVARVPGAVSLRSDVAPSRAGPPCAGLVAVTTDGTEIPVPLPGGPP